MSRSPLAYPLTRGIDGESGGAADLQTDIMRFMAILALCLVAIFALVQSLPLAPASVEPTAAAEPPVAPPSPTAEPPATPDTVVESVVQPVMQRSPVAQTPEPAPAAEAEEVDSALPETNDDDFEEELVVSEWPDPVG